jgi:hypothetical protein
MALLEAIAGPSEGRLTATLPATAKALGGRDVAQSAAWRRRRVVAPLELSSKPARGRNGYANGLVLFFGPQ